MHPVGWRHNKEGPWTPVHLLENSAGSTYSSTSDLLPREQLERQAKFHFSTEYEAWLSCPNSAGILRSESEMERNPEVPSSTRDEALLYYTTPSGVPRGPSQLHSISVFSEAPWATPWGHRHKSREHRVSCRNPRKTSRVRLQRVLRPDSPTMTREQWHAPPRHNNISFLKKLT